MVLSVLLLVVGFVGFFAAGLVLAAAFGLALVGLDFELDFDALLFPFPLAATTIPVSNRYLLPDRVATTALFFGNLLLLEVSVSRGDVVISYPSGSSGWLETIPRTAPELRIFHSSIRGGPPPKKSDVEDEGVDVDVVLDLVLRDVASACNSRCCPKPDTNNSIGVVVDGVDGVDADLDGNVFGERTNTTTSTSTSTSTSSTGIPMGERERERKRRFKRDERILSTFIAVVGGSILM